jgi:type IV pilus assembly protein PilO
MLLRRALLKVVWEQNRNILVTLSLLLLVCGGFSLADNLYVEPELETLLSEQTSLHSQLRQLQQRVTAEGMPLSTAERMASDLREFHAKIPSKAKFADFIGDLFSWADKVDLTIRQVAYQPKAESDSGFLEYGLSFSVQGDYGQLKKFIHLLENSSRILIVNNIALTGRPEPDGEKSEVALAIQLTTYFQESVQ